jgi:sec-independent protein translocase protein TatB
MFDIGWSELLIIGIVALIVIGPKELPGALRALGQWMTKIRRMASEFQNQFHEAMREAELAELKKEVDEMTAKAQSYAHFDPVEDIRKDIEKAVGPAPDLNSPAAETSAAAAATAAPATAETAPAPPTAADVAASDVPPPASNAAAATDEPVRVAEAEPVPTETVIPGAPTPDPPKPDLPKPDLPKPDTGRAA